MCPARRRMERREEGLKPGWVPCSQAPEVHKLTRNRDSQAGQAVIALLGSQMQSMLAYSAVGVEYQNARLLVPRGRLLASCVFVNETRFQVPTRSLADWATAAFHGNAIPNPSISAVIGIMSRFMASSRNHGSQEDPYERPH